MLDLSHHFLIAMPSLQDSWFARAVIYLIEHNENGATGVMINRPLPDFTLKGLLAEVEIADTPMVADQDMMLGGPVAVEQVFLLHPQQTWQHGIHNQWLSLTASRDALTSVAAGQGPAPILPIVGYAGWDAGQLEQEIADNAWLTVAADDKIIFQTDYAQRYDAAIRLLGFDPAWLAEQGGQA